MKKILILILSTIISFQVVANKKVGTVVKLQGKVEVYTNPSVKISGAAPHVLFNDKYYSVKKARLGFKIKNGNIIKTYPKSKTRLIYKNGDQFNVAENTTYEIKWGLNKKKKKKGSIINLMYGSFRSIISKKGPRNNMKIKTKTASMGVRGTDFVISKNGSLGAAELTVLRGNVEFKSTKKNSKALNVASGFSAKIAEVKKNDLKNEKQILSGIKIDEKPTIQLKKTNKVKLLKIQKMSSIEPTKEEKVALPKELEIKISELEDKAVETTMDDIKTYDPNLYEKLKKEEVKSVAQINSQVVKKIFKEAPKEDLKPDMDDLSDLEENAYDRYFNVE